MEEYKVKLILDSLVYKLSYTQDGKQKKISVANEKDISLCGVQKLTGEVEELLSVSYGWDMLCSMMQMNIDAQRASYTNKLIKFSNPAIDLAMRIMYPEQYQERKRKEDEEKKEKVSEIRKQLKPIVILNIGCTGTGKTRFILGAILTPEEFRNFGPSLTSVKETTACSIVYHINAEGILYGERNDFKVRVQLKEEEIVEADIQVLIVEAFEEYISTIKNRAKDNISEAKMREEAMKAVEKRLALNCDKTFGLGQRDCNIRLAKQVEALVRRAFLDYYGNSKSIDRIADEDENYVIKQLVKDFKDNNTFITTDDILAMMNQYTSGGPFKELLSDIKDELLKDLASFNCDYELDTTMGNEFTMAAAKKDSRTMILLSNIFGNKNLQKNEGFYTIEPMVKKAEFFMQVERLKYLGRELILSDSVGLNQGQTDAGRKKEIALRRMQQSIQERQPDIVIYHTRLITNDDYMLDIIKELNMEGYGKYTYVAAGRLDTMLKDRMEADGIEELTWELFDEFIQEVKELYVEKDIVSLASMIGDNNYLICDKTNSISRNFPGANTGESGDKYESNDNHESVNKYGCAGVLDTILNRYEEVNLEGIQCSERQFMDKIAQNFLCEDVYDSYLKGILNMIPLDYNTMRWNTLQKAIEKLYANNWGFSVLCPALLIRQLIANSLKESKTEQIFVELFGEKADAVLQIYLYQATIAAQVVLVTEYKAFMLKLLRMRYDITLRTDLTISMTEERKRHLRELYKRCFSLEGTQGEFGMKMIFHIAWLRTSDYIEKGHSL